MDTVLVLHVVKQFTITASLYTDNVLTLHVLQVIITASLCRHTEDQAVSKVGRVSRAHCDYGNTGARITDMCLHACPNIFLPRSALFS